MGYSVFLNLTICTMVNWYGYTLYFLFEISPTPHWKNEHPFCC